MRTLTLPAAGASPRVTSQGLSALYHTWDERSLLPQNPRAVPQTCRESILPLLTVTLRLRPLLLEVDLTLVNERLECLPRPLASGLRCCLQWRLYEAPSQTGSLTSCLGCPLSLEDPLILRT